MASKIEVAAQLMEHLCVHDWHGYSQPHRHGDGEGYCDVVIDGVTYQVWQGDRDCSSAVIECCKVAGIPVGNASYTGNMKSEFLATGQWEWHDMSYTAHRGDVYLSIGNHTAMCLNDNPDTLGEFSISETGGIDGATGDQTGKESRIRSYYDYPWNGILHYIGGGSAPGPEPTTPKPSLFLSTYYEQGLLCKIDGYATGNILHVESEGYPITKLRMWLDSEDWMMSYSVFCNGEFLPVMADKVDTGGSSDDFAGDGEHPFEALLAHISKRQ